MMRNRTGVGYSQLSLTLLVVGAFACSKKTEQPAGLASATAAVEAAPATSTPVAAKTTPTAAATPGAAAINPIFIGEHNEEERMAALAPDVRERYREQKTKCYDKDAAACESVCNEFGAETCREVVSMMNHKMIPDDPAKRAKISEHGCVTGSLKSCNLLGSAYEEGDGVLADLKKAMELFAKSCDGGEGSGCVHQGDMYRLGKGRPADFNMALKLYAKGCDAGDGGGCYNVANTYGYGDEVPQDLAKAKVYSDKACALKHQNCKPPFEGGQGWPADAKLEDVLVNPKKWDGQFVQLRGIAAYRGSPTSGFIFAVGGNPATDGVSTMMSENADEDAKKAWLRLPSSRKGILVKKVMVRVQATMVPSQTRFWIEGDLQI